MRNDPEYFEVLADVELGCPHPVTEKFSGHARMIWTFLHLVQTLHLKSHHVLTWSFDLNNNQLYRKWGTEFSLVENPEITLINGRNITFACFPFLHQGGKIDQRQSRGSGKQGIACGFIILSRLSFHMCEERMACFSSTLGWQAANWYP